MANRQKFRDSTLLVSAFLLLDINFDMITTAVYGSFATLPIRAWFFRYL